MNNPGPDIYMLWLLPVVLFISTTVLTGLMLPILRRWNLIDIPNNRSSHDLPKPRGGGLPVVITYLVGFSFLAIVETIPLNVYIALAGGGFLAALVGLWDDFRSPSQLPRLVLQLIAVIWAMVWLDGSLITDRFGAMMWWSGTILLVLGLLWLINLFNFMDGIDGIAGIQTISAAGLAGIFLMKNGLTGAAASSWLLAAAAAGFLVWNWPPSKVFLGDTGSIFLGFWFSINIVWTSTAAPNLFIIWIILLGVFLVDASITLAVRILRREKWYLSHKSHAYQHAAEKWGHFAVTSTVGLINIFWLFPWAYIANARPDHAPLILFISLTPLVALAIILGAGKK